MNKQTTFLNKGRRLLEDDRGSMTLEGSIVLPVTAAVIMLMLLFGLLVYERVLIVYTSMIAAERTAFRWDNSHRDAITGKAPAGRHDPLYWRITDNSLLHRLFGPLLTGDMQLEPTLGLPARAAHSTSLPVRKMIPSASRMPETISGEMSYKASLISASKIVVEAAHQRMKGPMTVQASIVDPVEFIRSVELVLYYKEKLRHSREPDQEQERAAGVLKSRLNQYRQGGP